MPGTHPRIDVIVPYGHAPSQPERQANLVRVLTDLGSTLAYADYKVVLAELGPHPTQRALAREAGAQYVFSRTDEEFSPGRAMNRGFLARSRPADLVYFHQADFLVFPDVLLRAVETMSRLDCPFVYPYWGEVHLSAAVSAAVRESAVEAGLLIEEFRRCVGRWRTGLGSEVPRTDGFDEFEIPDEELRRIRALLPEELLRRLAASSPADLWGEDDRSHVSYRWEPTDSPPARICRISGGPRASAAYLATDAAFRAIGGVPELPGWGFEDLIMWEFVRAFHPYTGDRHGIRFLDQAVTSGHPLVHLWHPVGGRPEYYAAATQNERLYHEIRALTPEGLRARVTPMPAEPRADPAAQEAFTA